MAIEFGLILPVLLLFTFGIMDFGLLLWTNTTLTRATQAAARCGALSSTACPESRPMPYARHGGSISPQDLRGRTGNLRLQSERTYTYNFLTPWFPRSGFGAIWRPYHNVKCSVVLSEAILAAEQFRQVHQERSHL